MNGNEYQKLAMRTNDKRNIFRLLDKISKVDYSKCDMGGIINGCLGLSGEVGEFVDLIKKWIFHEKILDDDHAMKELGDILWYIAMICHSFGWSLDSIMEMNIEKLKARYPEGFSVEKSAHRPADDV